MINMKKNHIFAARVVAAIIDVIFAGCCAFLFRDTGNMWYAVAIFGCAVSMTLALYDV